MKRSVVSVFAVFIVAAAVAFVSRPATKVEQAFEGRPELVAATFSSAWCPPCRILKPRLAKALPAFRNAPVKFVDYDFTFGEIEKLRKEAAADGLGAAFDRYSKATGFTLLVDAETGEVIDILTIDYSAKAMRASIERALAVAEATAPEAS